MIVSVPTADDMRELGRQLGRELLNAGPVPQVIALNGDLGAGKTTFVAGVLAGMGVTGAVRSPTYTLIEPYEAGGRFVYHLDLYRLTGPQDLEPLGLRDLHANDSTLLIEWAARGGAALPPVDLSLRFTYVDTGVSDGGASREVEVDARSSAGHRLIAALVRK